MAHTPHPHPYILDLEYLNEACFLSLNTDDKKYNMVLKMAQHELQEIIGHEFYDQISTQYPNFTTDSDNHELYDNYIKDYLAWQTYFYYLKFANAEATPTGIREFNDENSSVLSDVKMYSFEKNILDASVRYKNRMINYLKEQQIRDATAFPLYKDSCKESFSFAISAIDKRSDSLVKVNKSIITNE